MDNAALETLLNGCVGDADQIKMRVIERRAMSHDASHFLLLPQAVVTPRNADEVGALLRAASTAGVGLTFRSGGTSLSGQAVTDQVMADVRRHFTDVEVLDNGLRVRVQPGVTVRRLNAYLAPYGRKFGPDPASEAACTVGGVVANNSSGMACGTVENTYRTLESVVVVLASGTVLDTGANDANEKLRACEPELYEGLIRLRDQIRSNPASMAKIAQQFSMKNTMGYGINSYVDFDTPADILTHLMIGSEGTLGFIASATYRTIPNRSHMATALMVFKDLYDANRSLPEMVATGAAALELMDATSLRVGQSFPDALAQIKALKVDTQAAILLEYQSTDADELEHLMVEAQPVLAQLPTLEPVQLTSDPVVRGNLWTLRKGLYTSVAGARPSGTTALLEDVVVPVEQLADTCVELGKQFNDYGYANSVIFGHAKDGNIHFMLTDRFESSESMKRYAEFTEVMVDLILSNNGSLKAEHGTGRVMAPFVRRQYGDELYEVMVETKRLFDPSGLLNSGVLMSTDAEAHLRDIKQPVAVDADIDRCVECGYCEPVCPSRNLTLTPRQRIAVLRDISEATVRGDAETVAQLKRDYPYDAVHTCAVDGMCGTVCPVQINTGLLVKKFRKKLVPGVSSGVWTFAAKHWSGTTKVASAALNITDALPRPLESALLGVDHAARAMIGEDVIPLWSRELPGGGPSRKRDKPSGEPAAVYVPACVNVMFGPAEGPGAQASFEKLCAIADIRLLVPEEIESMCCGTPWSSKGIPKGYDAMRSVVIPALKKATDNWRLPIVCDASSCTEGIKHMLETDPNVHADIIDAVSFVAQRVLPVLGDYELLDSLTIHPTCSSTQMGLNPDLLKVAKAVAETVNVPINTGCCAFAGDRGLLHPELTYAATRPEAAEVAQFDGQAHASCNRTCELGMTRATGKTYRHVLELLADQVGNPS